MEDRKAIYKQIKEEHADTGKPLSALCKSHGVTYQAYHSWEMKQTDSPSRITVTIGMTDLLHAFKTKTPTIKVSVNEIMLKLTEDQRRALYQEWGRLYLEREINGAAKEGLITRLEPLDH